MNRLLSTALLMLLAFNAYGQSIESQALPTPLVTSTKSKASFDSLPSNVSGYDGLDLYLRLINFKHRLVKSEFETTVQYEKRIAEELQKPIIDNLTIKDTFSLVTSVQTNYDADSQRMNLFLTVNKSGDSSRDKTTSRDLSRVNLYTIQLKDERGYESTDIFFDDLSNLPLTRKDLEEGFSTDVTLAVEEAKRLKTTTKALVVVQFQEPYVAFVGRQLQVRLIDVVFFDPQTRRILARMNQAPQSQVSSASPSPETSVDAEKKDGRPRVDQVIERAEDHFRKGKSNLEDNKREQARDEFDKAIDEILVSGLDVSSNWRLRTFYLALVEKIYREEMPLIRASSSQNATPVVAQGAANPKTETVEVAKVQQPKQVQPGFRQQGFDPSPLDPLSKLVLTEDEKGVSDRQLAVDSASLTKVRARKGDTIAKIAAARNLSADKLARLNGIAPTLELQAGQEVKLPGGTSGAPGRTISKSARDEYIKTTKEYKTSLEKLLLLYQASQTKAEERLATAKTQFTNGLVQKEELEANERAVADARTKVDGVRQQIADADKQIDQTLNELREQRSSLLRSKQVEDALLGSKPTQLANGTVPIVMKWFQENLHDPYSARYVHWSKIERSSFANGPCWEVTVRLRAKNALGAYVLSDNTFYIRRNRIVYYQKT